MDYYYFNQVHWRNWRGREGEGVRREVRTVGKIVNHATDLVSPAIAPGKPKEYSSIKYIYITSIVFL